MVAQGTQGPGGHGARRLATLDRRHYPEGGSRPPSGQPSMSAIGSPNQRHHLVTASDKSPVGNGRANPKVSLFALLRFSNPVEPKSPQEK
jgi:hypothetical protein